MILHLNLKTKNIIIGQNISRIGTKSFDIQSAIFTENDMRLVCISTVTSVCFNFIKNQSVEVFEEVKKDYNG